MKNQQRGAGVNPRKAPSYSEGLEVLSQCPEIRDRLRYRSGRWERKYQDGRWRVRNRQRAQNALTHWKFGLGLTTRRAASAMLVLAEEGANIASDDLNPVLLTFPEFAVEVREFWMPKVRQFFKHRGRTFYEMIEGKWVIVAQYPESVDGKIAERLHQEFGKSPMPKSKAACPHELILENRPL